MTGRSRSAAAWWKRKDNMEDWSRFLIVFADILVPLFLGKSLRARGIAREWMRFLIRANVVGALSGLSLISFWSLRVSAELLWLPLSILPICFLPIPLFYLLEKRRFSDPRDQGSYFLAMILGNIGTLAGLCAYTLFGETGFAYIQLIAVPQVLVIVLFCFPAAQRFYDRWASSGETRHARLRLRDMLLTWNQLPAACVAAGLLLGASGVHRPEGVSAVFTVLIHASAWLGMIPVGYDLDMEGVRKYARTLWPLFPVKFLYLPVCIGAMTRCVTGDPVILWCAVLAAAAPTAIFAVAASQLYRLNVDIAESAFLTTTAVFLFLVYPLIYYFART